MEQRSFGPACRLDFYRQMLELEILQFVLESAPQLICHEFFGQVRALASNLHSRCVVDALPVGGQSLLALDLTQNRSKLLRKQKAGFEFCEFLRQLGIEDATGSSQLRRPSLKRRGRSAELCDWSWTHACSG